MFVLDSDIAVFLREAKPLLERDEGLNNLLLGLAYQLLANSESSSSEKALVFPILARISHDGVTTCAALQTPPNNIIITKGSPADISLLATELAKKVGPEVAGLVGPVSASEIFAPLFSSLRGHQSRLAMHQGVYELRKVQMPKSVVGELRQATLDEIPAAAKWIEAFVVECIPHEAHLWTAVGHAKNAEDKIKKGFIHFLRVNGEAVSMAALGRPTERGVTINLVYTPPALRGKGYASETVARLSQKALDQGFQFCTLYTDLSNPTSNSIYQKVGYRFLDYSKHFMFEKI